MGLFELGATSCRLGDYDQSRHYFRDSLQILKFFKWRAPQPLYLAQILASLSRLLAATGQPARAVEVLTAALPPLNCGLWRAEAEEMLAGLEAGLPADEFAAARARGAAADLAALAAALLEELEEQEEASSPVRDFPRQPARPLPDPLSERELEVLQFVADGWSNREIAEELVVTVGTVKKHINNIFGKLQARSRTQAVARARQLNLLT